MSAQSMKAHIDVLGWLHVVFGILSFISGLFVFVALSAVGLWVTSQEGTDGGAELVVIIGWLVGGLLMLISLPQILAGVGLLRRRGWGRVLAIVVSVLALPSFPLGTALGIYGLWALLSQQTVADFEAAAQARFETSY